MLLDSVEFRATEVRQDRLVEQVHQEDLDLLEAQVCRISTVMGIPQFKSEFTHHCSVLVLRNG